MLQISDKTALANYASNLQRARWSNKNAEHARDEQFAYKRLCKDIFVPVPNNNLVFGKKSKFFAMGSCFAREVEHALESLGINILSLAQPGTPIHFRRGGYTNRYNTCSMLNEIKFAFDIEQFDERSVIAVDSEKTQFLDLHSQPAGGFVDFEETLARRRSLKKHFAQLATTDVFVVTLGLSETWFDRETNQYINLSPATGRIIDLYPGRFEFRVLSHAENMEKLEEIYSILKDKVSADLKIIVTTSPVPLLATFSARDVVTANTHSKATLRSCAEQWCWSHPGEIEYFPSYEMAMNSNPNLVWREDRIHVQPVFVRQIMRQFVSQYIKGADDALLTSPDEEREIKAVIADGLHYRSPQSKAARAADADGSQGGESAEFLASACKRAFRNQDFDGCMKNADKILALWTQANPRRQKAMRRDASIGVRYGCFAAFKANDADRGLMFFESSAQISKVSWGLGIRVAKIVGRKQSAKVKPIMEKLREWKTGIPKRERQFEKLMKEL